VKIWKVLGKTVVQIVELEGKLLYGYLCSVNGKKKEGRETKYSDLLICCPNEIFAQLQSNALE